MNTIEKFYTAFKNLDADAMCECYSEDVEFSDPAFGKLKGERAKNMWKMLVESQKGKDFKIEFDQVEHNGDKASAKWEAKYTFSQTGRKIHNKISAQFELKNDKIVVHKDNFDLHSWATQALGIKGWLLGWTGFFRSKLQNQTGKLLDKFEAKASE